MHRSVCFNDTFMLSASIYSTKLLRESGIEVNIIYDLTDTTSHRTCVWSFQRAQWQGKPPHRALQAPSHIPLVSEVSTAPSAVPPLLILLQTFCFHTWSPTLARRRAMQQFQRDACSELWFERTLLLLPLLLLTAAMRYTTVLILAQVRELRLTALMGQGALCRLNCS